ncbi:MAG: SIR2 family protein [Propionibacteriaceae bacterium]|nr:SIR2 family protein [Propionibacteriaceae bacterium]
MTPSPLGKGANERVFDDLMTVIDDLIPFVGAGLTAGAGYPTWGPALAQMAQHVPGVAGDWRTKSAIADAIGDGRLDEAADALYEAAGPAQFADALTAAFGTPADPSVVARLPVSLLPRAFPTGPVVTTNFDQVLETAVFAGDHRFGQDPIVGPVRFRDERKNLVRKSPRWLIKWHGCVSLPDEVVFTAAQYEARYGAADDPTDTAEFLTDFFSARPMLFLGCGLWADRTVGLLTRIAAKNNYPHYALIARDEDPDKFKRHARILSDARIKPLWYPAGQHDAYVRLLLETIAARRPPGAVPPESNRQCLGRETAVASVLALLARARGAYAVEVRGAPGVGKSTVCAEAIRRHRAQGRSAIRADLAQVTTHTAALASIGAACGVDTAGADPERALLTHARATPDTVLYLDNTEDPQEDPAFTEWLTRFVAESPWTVLYSTQTHIARAGIRSELIGPLDAVSAGRLFRDHWGEAVPDEHAAALDQLLTDADHHPLNLVLLGSQRPYLQTVPALQVEYAAGLRPEMNQEHERHRSMEAACRLALSRVAGVGERRLLGVMTHVPDRLPRRVLDLLPFPAQDAAHRLVDASLVEPAPYPDGTPAYRMLSPVRSEVGRRFTSGEAAADDLARAYTALLDRTRPTPGADTTVWHRLSFLVLPQILALLRSLNAARSQQTSSVAHALHSHWSVHPALAAEVLDEVASDPAAGDAANLAWGQGEAARYSGNLDDARTHYQGAVGLHEQVGDRLGHAGATVAVAVSLEDSDPAQAHTLLAKGTELYTAAQAATTGFSPTDLAALRRRILESPNEASSIITFLQLDSLDVPVLLERLNDLERRSPSAKAIRWAYRALLFLDVPPRGLARHLAARLG